MIRVLIAIQCCSLPKEYQSGVKPAALHTLRVAEISTSYNPDLGSGTVSISFFTT